MKKRTIKSLELNKKTISTIETDKVHGGSYSVWTAYLATVGYATAAAADALIDYLDNE
ncbi:hypothetical protein KORDIASMS9_04304 [Kordia sp. SMS9]|uniref:hypothetical protein n=1 Tax=Kordia sp. SMS9 TaxID=2282170 RepID=UPI000E104D8B|nr:hypothetical protein [Kordia sp. SMS9]AXG72042.1 hypothetical protein KORDIASMS9_04304 [Kordia sp. SMS9]